MNQKYLLLFFIAIIGLGYTSCIKIPDQYMGPPPGKWRATLNLDGIRRPLNKDAKPRAKETLQFQDVTEGELPFNFELVYDNPDKIHINIQNGDEIIKVEDIVFGWERGTGNDTIIINFPHYDSYITALFEENVIEGKYIVKTRENYAIPFVAKFGEGHRFSTLKKTPKMDVSGKWEVTFGTETDDPYPAIGEFKQDGNHLLGTFITETGDYRFLEGTIQADKIYLSCFDGAHAFLFEAKILEDESMTGIFRSGSHYQTSFSAKKNDKFQLEDPEKMTFLKEGFDKLSFSFPNEAGVNVSLDDEAFKGKYKIVQILGTWCPNCADETAFLTQYFKENPSENIEIIGLAFEKHKEKERAFQAISKFKKRFGVNYPVLLAGGSSSKELAGEALPMLNKVISYPTMIFLDKNNKVMKIHTGFYGPATSKYKKFEEDFDTFVQKIPKD